MPPPLVHKRDVFATHPPAIWFVEVPTLEDISNVPIVLLKQHSNVNRSSTCQTFTTLVSIFLRFRLPLFFFIGGDGRNGWSFWRNELQLNPYMACGCRIWISEHPFEWKHLSVDLLRLPTYDTKWIDCIAKHHKIMLSPKFATLTFAQRKECHSW